MKQVELLREMNKEIAYYDGQLADYNLKAEEAEGMMREHCKNMINFFAGKKQAMEFAVALIAIVD